MSPSNYKKGLMLSISIATLSFFTQSAMSLEGHVHSFPKDKSLYSPYPEEDFPDKVFFGDTHLHTSYSADAGFVGATTVPDDAFRFAKGEMVTSSTGVPAKLKRPLDWLVVTDHSENLGLPTAARDNNPDLVADSWGKQIVDLMQEDTIDAGIEAYELWMEQVFKSEDPLAGSPVSATMWQEAINAAEKHNQPGLFTAFIG